MKRRKQVSENIHKQIKEINEKIEWSENLIKALKQEIKSRRHLIEQERSAIEELKRKRKEIMFSSFKKS
jgi:Arc/MetJ-type ribon-helix-helix transcriptional regulator